MTVLPSLRSSNGQNPLKTISYDNTSLPECLSTQYFVKVMKSQVTQYLRQGFWFCWLYPSQLLSWKQDGGRETSFHKFFLRFRRHSQTTVLVI